MGIDKFRIIATMLVIAIHTYPFLSINPKVDFIFTHILCRIGVPFFLMITGYFILSKPKKEIILYTKKIIYTYIICIIIYLPICIYAGKIVGFTDFLKDIFINGTFYHLWYFPALILGIWITYFLIKKFKTKTVIITIVILYLIGLFGDSYYGIIEKSEISKKIYGIIFNISDYTRNGIFYTPTFLYLGYIATKIKKDKNIFLILISITLMILEGLLLYKFNLQKHDSMYIMLIPTMIYIFNFLIQSKSENDKKLRNVSTTIYITHPIFIIVVRGISKIFNLQSLLIDNSIIHYLVVTILSVIFSVCIEMVKEKIKNEKKQSLDRS